MNRTALSALVWKEARILRQDHRFFVYLFALPLLLTFLLAHGIGQLPETNSGAAHAVPGYAVMFGFYVTTYIGVSHYREHAWGAWTLVRTVGLRRRTLVAGLVLPYFILGVAQLTLMIAGGCVLYRVTITGNVAGLVLLAIATELAIVGIAMTLLWVTTSLTSLQQLNQLIVLVVGAIGGALLPVSAMPDWTQPLARVTPQFWAVMGFRDLIEGHAGIVDIVPNVALLGIMGAGLLTAGARAFDPAKTRRIPVR